MIAIEKQEKKLVPYSDDPEYGEETGTDGGESTEDEDEQELEDEEDEEGEADPRHVDAVDEIKQKKRGQLSGRKVNERGSKKRLLSIHGTEDVNNNKKKKPNPPDVNERKRYKGGNMKRGDKDKEDCYDAPTFVVDNNVVRKNFAIPTPTYVKDRMDLGKFFLFNAL
jgi:hypothetical protein